MWAISVIFESWENTWILQSVCLIDSFCRAMPRAIFCLPIFTARWCHSILSACLSVCNHIGWNTLKIISPPNSLRSLLTVTLTWAIWLTHNSLQSADKDQQEMRVAAEKPHVAVSKCTAASRGHPCDSVCGILCCKHEKERDRICWFVQRPAAAAYL